MLQRLLTSALFAGFAAGLILALLQISLLSPVIIEAEAYESGALVHFEGMGASAPDNHAGGGETTTAESDAAQSHGDAALDDESWLARSSRTALSTILTSLGYAFLMVAGFAMAERSGINVRARSGILWGLAGFAAFNLATALGLPPELPGSIAAPLEARKLWWIGTALASAVGLASIAFGKNWLHWGVGIALLALPHIVGAPHPDAFGGVVPPELQGQFVGLSLGVSAIGWAVLGLLAGYMWAKRAE